MFGLLLLLSWSSVIKYLLFYLYFYRIFELQAYHISRIYVSQNQFHLNLSVIMSSEPNITTSKQLFNQFFHRIPLLIQQRLQTHLAFRFRASF
jgi:hypothetical protein